MPRSVYALGVPMFVATAPGRDGAEFTRPTGWQSLDPAGNAARMKAWRPGDAVCAVMGGPVAVIDVDPRNGGDVEAVRELLAALDVPV